MTQVQKAVEKKKVQMGCLAGGFEEVTCSFCGGQGTDPFGVLSWISTCVVCGGKGKVLVPVSHRRCAHCQGTGAIKRFTCTVCHGTGFVPELPEPLQVCPECGGSGDDTSISALACQTCRGRGVVPRRALKK
jgi:DnaJ-class molecular chaperone